MARPIVKIILKPYEIAELQRRCSAPSTSKRDHLRATIILSRSNNLSQKEVAHQLRVSQVCVSKWTSRFIKNRLEGLFDKAGRGRKSDIPIKKMKAVIEKAMQKPPASRTRWSVRTMAEEVGVSRCTVNRIWKKNDIKPHRTKIFKISKDPNFETKFWDVIGLYLNPPEKAIILCCDEKSQCQALERMQPGLPLGKGHIKTKTHDYYRHGTINLFAALNYITGEIIQRTEKMHTHVEWLRFLKQIKREIPDELTIHIIADNYSTHKHENVKNWLARNKRFQMHFTPTGSSWMNMVERFFADITNDVIRDGSFTNVKELVASIDEYIINRKQKPYIWKAEGQKILDKINRARDKLNKLNSETGH